MVSDSYDDLYTKVHPDYFETQRRDLWYYERLWLVLLKQLERCHPQRTMIEFGSGPGFLCALAERRWRRMAWRDGKPQGGMWPVIRGIEPSNLALSHARTLDLDFTEFCEKYNGRSKFRHAIATEVLEHVENPGVTLSEWREALIPDGFLALSVPNDNNPLQRLFGRWISPDRRTPKPWIHHTHKHYFDMKSLCELLEHSGFRVLWKRTSFPIELLLSIPLLPRHTAWKLSRLWPAPPLLWRLDAGRHLLVVAQCTS